MKNVFKITLALTLVVMMAAGCQQKSSTKKKSSTSSGLTGGGGGTDTNPGTGSGSIEDCDGIARYDATRCYYSDLPKITLAGTGTAAQGSTTPIIGPVLWSSLNNLPGYDLDSFETDSTFKLRIKAEVPVANEVSINRVNSLAKTCAGGLAGNFSRMRVYFMLRNSVTSLTSYYTADANVGSYGKKISLPVPKGAAGKILEVVGVATDHRCKMANPPAGCSAGTYWGDIPLVNPTPGSIPNPPTYCASFKIEYSTDTTYDLPAN